MSGSRERKSVSCWSKRSLKRRRGRKRPRKRLKSWRSSSDCRKRLSSIEWNWQISSRISQRRRLVKIIGQVQIPRSFHHFKGLNKLMIRISKSRSRMPKLLGSRTIRCWLRLITSSVSSTSVLVTFRGQSTTSTSSSRRWKLSNHSTNSTSKSLIFTLNFLI